MLADEQLQLALLRSCGRGDNVQTIEAPPVPSAELLLTDKDIREGDAFMAEMAEKRVVSSAHAMHDFYV